jgi:hypothetical protein
LPPQKKPKKNAILIHETFKIVVTGGYISLSVVQLHFSGLKIGGSFTLSLAVKNDGAGVVSLAGFA